MLKPMNPKQTAPNNIFLWVLVGLLVLSGVVALVAALGRGSGDDDELNVVYTNAAATLESQRLTLEASSPTLTPTVVTETPTMTFTPLASPTLFATQLVPTRSSGGTGSGAVGCNNSAYVADVTFPDNTVVTPGQAIKKTWKLQNTGSCAWSPTYKVTFQSGNAMGGVTTPIGVTVAPGTSADISIDLKAPTTAGDVIGYWILTNDSGQNFGSNFYIQVKVGAASASGTSTATATATTAPAPTAPAAVNNVNITPSCAPDGGGNADYGGTLTWEDKSNNEDGFNIYVNNVQIASVPANTTSYVVPASTYFFPLGTSIPYGVEAFNGVGKANIVTSIKVCP